MQKSSVPPIPIDDSTGGAAPAGALSGVRVGRLATIDTLRGISILWVTLYHFYVDTRHVAGAGAGAEAVWTALRRGNLGSVAARVAAALAALPAFRLDLFLLMTGMVLTLGPRLAPKSFLLRRARGVLPNYWLGSLGVALVLCALAFVRWEAAGRYTFWKEVRMGSWLGGGPYRFEPIDLLRSASVVGRFQSPRTMLVVAPSMWYLMLVLQAYLVFPVLRWLLARFGPARFLAVCLGGTWCARGIVFGSPPLGAFDAHAALLYFIPFRIAPVALGMVVASRAARLDARPGRAAALFLAAPALCLILAAIWLSGKVNTPGTVQGVVGPVAQLALALPGLWILARAARSLPGLGRALAWAGRHSLSVLVAQDALRLVIGTGIALRGSLAPYTWAIAPGYLAAAVALAFLWDPLPKLVTNRFWPVS